MSWYNYCYVRNMKRLEVNLYPLNEQRYHEQIRSISRISRKSELLVHI